MSDNPAPRVTLTCDKCGNQGYITWRETLKSGTKEAQISSIEVVGFYQQPGITIPAVFCAQCGTTKVPFADQ